RLKNPLAEARAQLDESVTIAEAPTGALAAASPRKAEAQKQTLRVDFDKLDLLLNLVGELVLSKAGLNVGIQGLASLGRELDHDRRLARRAAASVGHGVAFGRAGSVAALVRAGTLGGVASPAAGSTVLVGGREGDGLMRPLRHLAEELGRVER